MRAWLFQDDRQKKKLGEDKCPWSVGWIDPDGRRRSKKVGSNSVAEKFRKRKEGELANNLIRTSERMKWTEFRKRFEDHKKDTKSAATCLQYKLTLDQFETICKPVYMDRITSWTLDQFTARRSAQKGVEGSTVNKDLRHLRHAFTKAVAWGAMPDVPAIEFQRELVRDHDYIDDATFAKLYAACDTMTKPGGKHYEAADWWRALLAMGYLTGWRIRELRELEWKDVDLESGIVHLPAEKTKGRRDVTIHLNPVAVDHLRAIQGFDAQVFAWPHHTRLQWIEFAKLKKAAEVGFDGAFHCLRFGFANANVDDLPEDMLQHLMRHKDRATTRRYIHEVDRMRRASKAAHVHVPDVLRKAAN